MAADVDEKQLWDADWDDDKVEDDFAVQLRQEMIKLSNAGQVAPAAKAKAAEGAAVAGKA